MPPPASLASLLGTDPGAGTIALWICVILLVGGVILWVVTLLMLRGHGSGGRAGGVTPPAGTDAH